MVRITTLVVRAACAAIALAATAAGAQDDADPSNRVQVNTDPTIKLTFVNVASGAPAVMYEPVNPGPKAQIVVYAMHSALDYLNHTVCTELSHRGYRVLCANNSNDKGRDFNDGNWDQVLLQVKAGITVARKWPGVKKVVLWGHSGGASVMTSYQDAAENGVQSCQEAVKVYKCPDSLAGMPPADGIILGDANWGIANDVLTGIDPAIAIDNGVVTVNHDVDMFDPKNGFDPAGSHFTPEFVRKFTAAQAKRNDEIVDLALARWAAIKAGKGMYADNEPFFIAGAVFTGNKLYASDMSLLNHTQKPWPLLHKDGTTTTEIVHSVRVPTLKRSPSPTYGGALKTTVKGFLSSYAIRAAPDYGYGAETAQHGVVWRSTRGSNPGNVEGVTVPFLTLAMTGSFEMASAETIHEHVKAKDKRLVYVEGATHVYTPCKACEKTPGQYGDTLKTTYDYADKWLSEKGRFL